MITGAGAPTRPAGDSPSARGDTLDQTVTPEHGHNRALTIRQQAEGRTYSHADWEFGRLFEPAWRYLDSADEARCAAGRWRKQETDSYVFTYRTDVKSGPSTTSLGYRQTELEGRRARGCYSTAKNHTCETERQRAYLSQTRTLASPGTSRLATKCGGKRPFQPHCSA